MPVVDLHEKLSLFSDHWSPKVVARMNDYEVKVVKLQGEFTWHTHDDTDELFLVVDGELTIQLRDGDVTLTAGQAAIFSAVQALGRLLRRRASTSGSMFEVSVEHAPSATPAAPAAMKRTVR